MKTHKPNELPAFWWLNPWGYALELKRALHAVHELSEKEIHKRDLQVADLIVDGIVLRGEIKRLKQGTAPSRFN